MAIVSRSLGGEEDYARMRRFLVAIQPLVGSQIYATIGELNRWRWTDDDAEAIRHARLWFDEADDLVGFAWPAHEQIDVVVHVGHRELEETMLAWSEEYRQSNDGAGLTTSSWAYESDGTRQDVL